MSPDISIVIPIHNEEESLKILIPSLLEVIKTMDKEFEIILIDDVSTDNSCQVAAGFQEKNPLIKVLKLTKRGGQTGCYQKAFNEAKGRYIIRMDADMQDDPADLPLFMEKIDKGSELIMGLRECRKHARIIRFASGLYDLLILLLFNSPLHSNSGSYVCFKADLVQNITFKKNDHRYLPLIAIRRGAAKVSEVFVTHNQRQFGQSKYTPVKKIILGIPEVFRFLFRYARGYYDKKS